MKNYTRSLVFLIGSVMGILFFIFILFAQESSLSVANTSKYLGNGKWEFEIFVKAPPEEIESIQSVEYIFPSSFPTPEDQGFFQGDPKYPFAHKWIGYGVFKIGIKINYSDRSARSLEHMLSIEEQKVEKLFDIKADSDSRKIDDNFWEWTLFLKAPSEVLDKILLVKYTFPPLFSDSMGEEKVEVFNQGLRHRSFASSGYSEGSFQARICVYFKDGKVQDLNHNVRLRSPLLSD